MLKDLILVVDDNDGIRQLLFHILNGEGYNVELAKDGEEAVYKASIKKPSIILLDIYMPGINGIDTYKELQKIIPDTPVIFLSAYTEKKTLAKGIDDGLVKYFTSKPFDLTVLLNMITKVLKKRANNVKAVII